MGNPGTSWAEAERFLSSAESVPNAVKSLAVLRSASRRWRSAVDVKTSMHDLIFVMPGTALVDDRAVEVRWGPPAVLRLSRRRIPQDSIEVSLDTVGDVLDRGLAWLVDGTIWCARCGGQVVASAKDYVTFEHMHWVCFHFEFEHDLFGADVDTDCGREGCPMGKISGLTGDEAIVLFEWLAAVAEAPVASDLLTDHADRVAVDAVLCLLESRLAEPFADEYADLVAQARKRLRTTD